LDRPAVTDSCLKYAGLESGKRCKRLIFKFMIYFKSPYEPGGREFESLRARQFNFEAAFDRCRAILTSSASTIGSLRTIAVRFALPGPPAS
jgi:hypothetical protein